MGRLLETDLDADPLRQIAGWIEEARDAGVREPHAMAVATVGAHASPNVRMVLLKKLDGEGLVFCTDFGSPKAQEIDANPQVALLFYWADLERQIRVQGPCRRVSEQESRAYFHARPHESQVARLVGVQSQPIESRRAMHDRFQDLLATYAGREIPEPDWGGYRVSPEAVEFWQGGLHRLHDRIRFDRVGEGWERVRLVP